MDKYDIFVCPNQSFCSATQKAELKKTESPIYRRVGENSLGSFQCTYLKSDKSCGYLFELNSLADIERTLEKIETDIKTRPIK